MAGKNGAIDKSGLPKRATKAIENQSEERKQYLSGVHCGKIIEPEPSYIEADGETVIKGQNNSYIVLGRDRVTSMLTGYGGLGHTQASMIDLVVGRMASGPLQVDEEGQDMSCHPDPSLDAARIYISQKTDIDKNFNIASDTISNGKGSKIRDSISRSGIAIKADAVRVIGREGIKLVTRSDPKNSQGGDLTIVNGIELIAGNDATTLEPMPKGRRLTDALETMYNEIKTLNGVVNNMIIIIMKLYSDLANHSHIIPLTTVLIPTPFGPAPLASTTPTKSLPDPKLVAAATTTIKDLNLKAFKGCEAQMNNIPTLITRDLKEGGPRYINSVYNKVN